jgi:hypothetical protein
MTRYCYRCCDCLAVFFSDGKANGYVRCACGGVCEELGRVHGTSLVKDTEKCPCDGRCTNANGPSCDCRCGGENHGNGALVTFTHVAGKVVASNAPNQQRADEYRAALTYAQGRMAAKYPAGWLEYYLYLERKSDLELIGRARKARTHKTRIRILDSVCK